MAYDDRSVKPMSASLMRARVATKILAGSLRRRADDVDQRDSADGRAAWR